MDILLSFQYKTLVDEANFHGSLRLTLNFPGIKLLGSYILSNRSKHRTLEEHNFYLVVFNGTFCFPFETSSLHLFTCYFLCQNFHLDYLLMMQEENAHVSSSLQQGSE